MPAHEFVFMLELSDNGHDDRMLADVARRVLGHVGYGRQAIDALVALIRTERAHAPATEPCHVKFHAHAGELHIVVSYAGREWQTRRPLP